MNQAALLQQPASPNTWHMLRAMGGVGILCSVLIVFTYQTTLPTIEKNKAAALEKAIFTVLPGAVSKTIFRITADNRLETVEKAEKGDRLVYAGYDTQSQLAGVAIEASGQGFQDVIRVIYGYNPDKQVVIGFRVLESKETPGLGDKIEKDAEFLKNFEALDVSVTDDQSAVQHRIVPVKKGEKNNPWEIDCITGATISSKAIANILGANTSGIIPVLMQNLDILKKPLQDFSAVDR